MAHLLLELEDDAPKVRDYCFTCNNYTPLQIETVKALKYKYLVFGFEIAPTTGTPHLQGYIYLKSAMSQQAIRKALKGFSLYKCGGTAQQNYDYCTKDNNFFQDGTMPEQGKRTDIDKVREIVTETGRMRDVVATAQSYQSIRVAEVYLTYHEKKRDWMPHIKWFWGPTGTGKSHMARELLPNAYVCGETNQWWQGYDAHEDVIINDFRPEFCKFATLLNLFDKYAQMVMTKGGSRQLLAKRMVITCPEHPKDLFEGRVSEDIQQFIRRLKEIRYFGDRYIEEVDDDPFKF